MDLSQRAGTRNSPESRSTPFDGCEIRSVDDGNTLRFTGYASVFNRTYQVADMFGPFDETVMPGAFRDSLAKGADVPFKINHEGMTLARTKSGTMRLAEDSHGLHVEADLDPSNPHVQALRSAMKRGDIDEMSFAFYVTDDVWSADWTQRTINAVDIDKGDVSAVNYGANPFTAGASLRSADVMRAIRAAKAGDLDPDSREALLHVLQLISAADAAVDVAQPCLAEVLGVPNPDIDAASVDQISEDSDARALNSLYALRLRALSL
jgi:HK97 family phage prohead protease